MTTFKAMRDEMGLSQRKIADELNITPSFYCYIENYKRKMPIEKLVEFSILYERLTGKTVNFLKDVRLY